VKFLHSEVVIEEGEAIRVSLKGSEARVMVMDERNFFRYRNGSRFEFAGGSYGATPAMIRPPRGGSWNVVIDLGNYAGNVEPTKAVAPTPFIMK